MAEFAAHGVAGARVDRIAATAGCNKNLIYIYFTDKETLFSTVLQNNLTRVYEQVPFTPDDLADYAGRCFDFMMGHPDLMRLMTWFTLEQTSKRSVERGESFAAKVEAVHAVQTEGKVSAALPPAFLITLVMSLAAAWAPTNPFGPSLDPEGARHPVALRRNIVAAVRLLTRPQVEHD